MNLTKKKTKNFKQTLITLPKISGDVFRNKETYKLPEYFQSPSKKTNNAFAKIFIELQENRKKIDETNYKLNKIYDIQKYSNSEIIKNQEASIDLQKDQFEYQREQDYKKEHSLNSKVKEKNNRTSIIKEKIINSNIKGSFQKTKEKTSGFFDFIKKAAGVALFLKLFWPIIKRKVIPFVTDTIIPKIKDFVNNSLIPLFKDTLLPILKKIVKNTLWPLLKDNWEKFLVGMGIAGFLKNPLKFITTIIKYSFKGLFKSVGLLGKLIPKLSSFLTAPAIHLAKTIGTKSLELGKFGVDVIKNSKPIQKMMSTINSKLDSMGTNIRKMSSRFKESVGVSLGKIPKSFGAALKLLKPLTKLVPFLGTALMVWDVIDMFFPRFTEKLSEFFSWDNIKSLAGSVWDKVKNTFNSLSTWFGNKLAGIIPGIRKFIGKIFMMNPIVRALPESLTKPIYNFIVGDKKILKMKEQSNAMFSAGYARDDWGSNSIDENKIKEGLSKGKIKIEDLESLLEYGNLDLESQDKLRKIIKLKKKSLPQKAGMLEKYPKSKEDRRQNAIKSMDAQISSFRKTKTFLEQKLEKTSDEKEQEKIKKAIKHFDSMIESRILKKKSLMKPENPGSLGNDFSRNPIEYEQVEETKPIAVGLIRSNDIKPSKVNIRTSISAAIRTKDKKPGDVNKLQANKIFKLTGSAASGGFEKMNKGLQHNVKLLGLEYTQRTGEKLVVNSAYRSVAHQKKLYNKKLKEVRSKHPDWSESQVVRETRRWVAPPGRSAHNSGLAIDIGYQNKKSPSMDKADKMGLLSKYGLGRILPNEPWHITPSNLSRQDFSNIANDIAQEVNQGTFNENNITQGVYLTKTTGSNISDFSEPEITQNDINLLKPSENKDYSLSQKKPNVYNDTRTSKTNKSDTISQGLKKSLASMDGSIVYAQNALKKLGINSLDITELGETKTKSSSGFKGFRKGLNVGYIKSSIIGQANKLKDKFKEYSNNENSSTLGVASETNTVGSEIPNFLKGFESIASNGIRGGDRIKEKISLLKPEDKYSRNSLQAKVSKGKKTNIPLDSTAKTLMAQKPKKVVKKEEPQTIVINQQSSHLPSNDDISLHHINPKQEMFGIMEML